MDSREPSDQRQTQLPVGFSGRLYRRDDPEALAALRDQLGDEAVQRVQRLRELSRQPRPLTADERAVVWETAAPVLRDLAVSGLPAPELREEAHEDRGTDAVCAWIQCPDGTSGQGIWIWLASSPAERVAALAAQFQSWAADELHEDGRPSEWPGCPEHPRSHALSADVDDGSAFWTCPVSDHRICEIGALTLHRG